MGGPKDGKYYILPAVDPKLIVGVDGVGNPWVPIITDGKHNVFTVKKTEKGNYTLVIEGIGGPYFVQNHEKNLVGSEKPPASEWTIAGKECGPYTITVPTFINWSDGWTLKSDKPKTPIALGLVEIVFPEQLWNFVPWIGPEYRESAESTESK